MPNNRPLQINMDHGSLTSFWHLIRKRGLDLASRELTIVWSSHSTSILTECDLNNS